MTMERTEAMRADDEDEDEASAEAPEEDEPAGAEAPEEDEPAGAEPGSDAWLAEQMRLTAQLQSAYDEPDAADEAAPEYDDEEEVPDAAWVRCSHAHRKLFLHRGGRMRDGVWRTFGEVCPKILARLLEAALDSELWDATWRATECAVVRLEVA